MDKWISQCKVGDMVIIDKELYSIVDETKKQFVCMRHGSTGLKSDFEHIMKQGGKVVGRRSGYHANFAHALETSVEEFIAAKQAIATEKKAAADESQRAWNTKIAAVRAANSNIVVSDEGLGLKKASMVNEAGEQLMVFFSVKEEEMWFDYSKPSEMGVRLTCSTWAGHWHDYYSFSQTSINGRTINDALIELVAGHYWN